MSEELMNFDLPVERSSIIKVLGVGGGGNNAVNQMYAHGIKDVNFVICNTDAQALSKSLVPLKVQLGESLTEGRGAGSKPEIGRQAAMENLDAVMETLSGNTKMVFVTAGMGGGTGTGAAPVIAKACKEAGYLTIGVVTIPFKSEGRIRTIHAVEGIKELKNHVDSLLVINNEKLREIYGDQPVSHAFGKADEILLTAVKGIAEIITVTGYINVDFADVETVMRDSGVAVMGMGTSNGEQRAMEAIETAISSPLLNSNDITGARSILLNIASGPGEHEVTMDELGEITDYVYDVASPEALIIRGLCIDETLGDQLQVTVIAAGFEANSIPELYKPSVQKQKVVLGRGKPEGLKELNDFFAPEEKPGGTEKILRESAETHPTLDFSVSSIEEAKELKEKKKEEEITHQKKESLQKIKKMQEMLKSEGFTNKEVNNNIDVYEDVPAYVRRNIQLAKSGHSSEEEISRFTLGEDEENQPKLRDDNAYLNDNVD